MSLPVGLNKDDLRLSFGKKEIKLQFYEQEVCKYQGIKIQTKSKSFSKENGTLLLGNFSFYWYNFEKDPLVYFMKYSSIHSIEFLTKLFKTYISINSVVGSENETYKITSENKNELESIYQTCKQLIESKDWEKKIAVPTTIDAILYNNDIDILEMNRSLAHSSLDTIQDLKQAKDKIKNAINAIQSFNSLVSKIDNNIGNEVNSHQLRNTDFFNYEKLDISTDNNNDTRSIINKLIENSNGIISTISLYGLYQRYIKSYEIYSPAEFIQLLKGLSDDNTFAYELYEYKSPINAVVMRSKEFGDEIVGKTILNFMKNSQMKCISVYDLSEKWNIPTTLSNNMLLMGEKYGYLCRDKSIEGLFYYPNIFLNDQLFN